MIATSPTLEVHGLSAGYQGNRYALRDATFTVHQGESVAVIGPNGAGKSTLFKAIAGLIPHTSGHISIHGRDCKTSHTMVGYVPQHEAIDWHFPVTVQDVVMMGRTRHIGWLRWPRANDWQVVHQVLHRLSLTPYAHRQIGELSGGQKRRVFIARALAQETDVLLLDEPFAGVDTSAEQEIWQTLDTLHAQGITMLLATHDLVQASERFDKVLLVKNHVIAYGYPHDVMRYDTLQQTYGGIMRFNENGHETVLMADDHGCC